MSSALLDTTHEGVASLVQLLSSRRNSSTVRRTFLRPVYSTCEWDGVMMLCVLSFEALSFSVYVVHIIIRALKLTFPTTLNPIA